MISLIQNILSADDILYITQLPEVISEKAKIDAMNSGKIYFTIPLTESIRIAINTHFGLNLSNMSSIPMRWIKGDTPAHIDTGASKFENTYIIYLNDSPGEFLIENVSYPITANTGYVFNEGLTHKTINTGINSRLLIGPMNEFVEPVGTAIYYYNNYNDALAANNNYIALSSSPLILGSNIYFGDIGTYTSWRVAAVGVGIPPSGVYNNGVDLEALFGSNNYYVYPNIPCFLEGTQVLCLINGDEKYIPVENIRNGTIVKTSLDGYKKVVLIGKGTIHNPGNNERIQNRLYICSPSQYPQLTQDLYITGCHSILVNSITDTQRSKMIEQLGRVFITDNKYRLITCVDERAEPWNSEGYYTIYHFALEHNDELMNYGIYVNGELLVETCCIYAMKNKSNMTLI
jgi:hypothetical protein